MDAPKLKAFAHALRKLLSAREVAVCNGHVLDLVSVLTGQDRWPAALHVLESSSCPSVSDKSIQTLSRLIRERYAVDVEPSALRETLEHAQGRERDRKNVADYVVWQGGPPAGVYLTTTSCRLANVFEVFDAEAPGAVIHADERLPHGRACEPITAGEFGSARLMALPRGSLLAVGPVVLGQLTWSSSAKLLVAACKHAREAGHRVVACIDSPAPENVHADVLLAVRGQQAEVSQRLDALIGVVDDTGHCIPAKRNGPKYRPSPQFRPFQRVSSFPLEVRLQVSRLLERRNAGVIVAASDKSHGFTRATLLESLLSQSEHIGPVACVCSGFSEVLPGDMEVRKDCISAAPLMPSIQSAVQLGYRRLIVDLHLIETSLIRQFSDRVLFLGVAFGADVQRALTQLRHWRVLHEPGLAESVIAVIARGSSSAHREEAGLYTVYIAGEPDAGARPEGALVQRGRNRQAMAGGAKEVEPALEGRAWSQGASKQCHAPSAFAGLLVEPLSSPLVGQVWRGDRT